MAELWTLPAWQALAREAARTLGAEHTDTVAAILAQWQCEQPEPAPWPPIHDNPGNLTRHIGGLDGEPHRLATTAPGVGLLYVYASPDIGALAYAHYLLNSSRYRLAVAKARAGDGPGFLAAVCDAGYGTRLGCCTAVYRRIHLPAPHPVAPEWVCLAATVNVRRGPGTGYAVTGHVHKGNRVAGVTVPGDPYTAGGKRYSQWLRIGTGQYTARAFYRQA